MLLQWVEESYSFLVKEQIILSYVHNELGEKKKKMIEIKSAG